MRIFYWIRYNLGKSLLILIVIWALVSGLKYCSSDSYKSKSRPSSIDFRPVKEGHLGMYTRRTRTHLEKVDIQKKSARPHTYSDPSRDDDQFTISNETQSMLIEMKKELSDYGVLMDDLLASIEAYYQKNKKGKKGPTKNDIIEFLPDHVKELIPENKRKYNETTTKTKDTKEKIKKTLDDEQFPPPSETIKIDQPDSEIKEEISRDKDTKSKSKTSSLDKNVENVENFEDSSLQDHNSDEEKSQDE